MSLDPSDAKAFLLFMSALLARDAFLGFLRGISKKVRGDKNPDNDVIADVADGLASGIEKLPVPGKR